jgi:hypothetical protein
MKVNSSEKYDSEDKVMTLFDCTMEGGFKLPTAEEFFIQKCSEFETMYMTHRDAVYTHGLAQDLHTRRFDDQLNKTMQTWDESESSRNYNQGKTKMTNVGFTKLFVACLAWALLCNNCDSPTTTLGKEFDDHQRCSVSVKKGGKLQSLSYNFKQSWHRNIKLLLKIFYILMPNDKFVFLFGFSSVKDMTTQKKMDFFPDINSHLKALGKFASAVNKHGVSTTLTEKIDNEPRSKFAYQLMLMQNLKSSITYYTQNKACLESLKVGGERGNFGQCFFLKSKKEHGNHLSLVGWHPKVLNDSKFHYWVPARDEEELESSDEDA